MKPSHTFWWCCKRKLTDPTTVSKVGPRPTEEYFQRVDRPVTAHHEAAHAVVLLTHDVRFSRVWIAGNTQEVDEEDRLGQVEPLLTDQPGLVTGHHLHANMMCSLSGPIAQKKFTGKRLWYRECSGDIQNFDEDVEYLLELGLEEFTEDDFNQLFDDAEQAVNELWPAIEYVAHLLLTHGSASYAELDQLLNSEKVA